MEKGHSEPYVKSLGRAYQGLEVINCHHCQILNATGTCLVATHLQEKNIDNITRFHRSNQDVFLEEVRCAISQLHFNEIPRKITITKSSIEKLPVDASRTSEMN